MEERKGWNPNTWDNVQWETYTSAIKKHFSYKHRLTQLLHDKLPLGHERHKCMSTYDPVCLACNETEETTKHMFQCSNDDYVQWRKSFFANWCLSAMEITSVMQ